jgi:outer membrane lipoprotein-sorting protein
MWYWPSQAIFVTRHALRVTALCVLLAGCASVTPTEDVSLRQATAEQLTTLLRQREAAIQSMKGLFTAKVRGGLIPIATRVEGTLYYRRPNAMRLRGFTSIGSELFEFVQVDDLYKLRLPTMGRVLAGRQSEIGDMGKLARPFQLSVWAMSGMLGTGTITAGETVKLAEDGDRYRLDVYENQSKDAPLLRRVWFDRHNLLVVQEDRLTQSGDLDATIRYEDFRLIENAEPGPVQAKAGSESALLRPFKILLEDGRGQGSVQVTFHEIVPNQVLKAEELGQIS